MACNESIRELIEERASAANEPGGEPGAGADELQQAMPKRCEHSAPSCRGHHPFLSCDCLTAVRSFAVVASHACGACNQSSLLFQELFASVTCMNSSIVEC